MQTPEAKSKASLGVKTNALIRFAGELPNADTTKFVAQVEVDEKKNNVSTEIFFKEKPGSLQNVFGSDRKFWNEKNE